MTKQQRHNQRMFMLRQAHLKRHTLKTLIYNIAIIIIILVSSILSSISTKADNIEVLNTPTLYSVENNATTHESTQEDYHEVEEVEKGAPLTPQYPEFTYSKDWDGEDEYLLAKITMCEAGNQDMNTKMLVVMTILNRVHSPMFPDTIYDVIFQERNGVHQFTPTADGAWEKYEPTEECYQAVRAVQEAQYDFSEGALFFESCSNEDNWHSHNLEFLFQSQDLRFYR